MKDHVLSESSSETCPGPHDEANVEESSRALRDERHLSNSPSFVAWRARARAKAIDRSRQFANKSSRFQLVKCQKYQGERMSLKEVRDKVDERDHYLEFSNKKKN